MNGKFKIGDKVRISTLSELKGYYPEGKHDTITGANGQGYYQLQYFDEAEMIARGSEVNHNHDWHEGDLIPYTEQSD